MVGYFAFPSTGPSIFPNIQNSRVPLSLPSKQTRPSASDAPEERASGSSEKAKQLQAERERVEEARRVRLEREREEIYLSELAWVRSGGILRDANGRRDKARTEEFRKEIRLQDEERAILQKWDAYENRLRAIHSSTNTAAVTWDTIPWPVSSPPSSPADLDVESVAEFIFATFKVRGAVAVRKERLRTSILRWHPDKFAALLARAAEHEQTRILDGVSAVFRALRQLQDEEKHPS
ncbi:hypothetical protein BDW22DRAFT_306514 [Trametopsis cervina]|nr:hypothetical protein BDW22DRAFT_306514 [Trametopsis cervina]